MDNHFDDGNIDRITGIVPELDQKKVAEFPGQLPDWEAFGLGSLMMSERMSPRLEAIWDDAGQKFTTQIGLDPDEWSVTNPHVQEAIQKAALAFCDETNSTTSLLIEEAQQKVREALIVGLFDHGESIRQLTKRVKSIFHDAETWRARRIAATEASRAVHQAQEIQAVESEIVTGWQWQVSEGSCEVCKTIARRAPAVKLGQSFAVIGNHKDYSQIKFPPAHPSCCLPETPVFAPIGVSGIVAQYDGPVVRLVFSDGTDVTVTPNHMLLTIEGFAPASALMEGDEIIRYCGADTVAGQIPDDDYKPSLIKDVIGTLAKSGCMPSCRVPVSSEYLHGDAAFCQGEIHVVTADRLLWNRLYLCTSKSIFDELFASSYVGMTDFVGKSNATTVLFALRDATDGGMSSLRESKARLWGRSRVPAMQSIGIGSRSDPHFEDSATDQRTADAKRLRQCQLRFPGKIATAKLVYVDHDSLHYCGPVYDVQTPMSLYCLGNGIASSNCRCTVRSIDVYEEQPRWSDTLIQPEPEEQDYEREIPPEAPRKKSIVSPFKSLRKTQDK